jgi:hypothetical protein
MKRVRLFLRLTAELNDQLRELLRYRGDLSKLVETDLSRDLRTMDLLSIKLGRDAAALSAVISCKACDNLNLAARQRHCSDTRLASSALYAWLDARGSSVFLALFGATVLVDPFTHVHTRLRRFGAWSAFGPPAAILEVNQTVRRIQVTAQ